MNSAEFQVWLRQTARSAGALDAGCLLPSSLNLEPLRQRFTAWLDGAGNRGRLSYIDRSLERRLDPFRARPWARNALVLCFPGQWGDLTVAPNLPSAKPGGCAGFISRYACGRDYHQTGQQILERLAGALRGHLAAGSDFRAESGVDTRAIPEVFLAVSAGLGTLGRNGLLRTPQHGSRVFIGVLFTDLELPEVRLSPQVQPSCADCARCTPACPTGALGADGLVRLDRCRSYLTLEHKGEFSPAQAKLVGDCLFGCDGCTAPCPPAPATLDRIAVDLDWLVAADAADIAERVRGSALEHLGPVRLKRNAAACLRRNV